MKTENTWLDNSHCIDLAALGFVNIHGQILFKKKRYNTVLEAKEFKEPGDVIAQSKNAVFILNPDQRKATAADPSLMIPSKVYF